MTKTEKICYESITPVVNLFWVPANWFVAALNEAVEEGFLTNHSGNKLIMEVQHKYLIKCTYMAVGRHASHSICFLTISRYFFFIGIFRFQSQLWRSLELQLGLDPNGLHSSAYSVISILKTLTSLMQI